MYEKEGVQYLGLSRSSLNSKVISLWDEKEKNIKMKQE